MHLVLFAGLWAMLAFTGVESQTTKYDAEEPQRCATFQDRFDIHNKSFCDKWMEEHRVKRVGEGA